MRPTYVSDVKYEHEAVPTADMEGAKNRAMELLFGAGITLDNVTLADVQLPRHQLRPLTAKQAASIAEKRNHIPKEFHHWYPESMVQLKKEGDEEEEDDVDDPKTNAKPAKVSKVSKKPAVLTGRASITSFFALPPRPSKVDAPVKPAPASAARPPSPPKVHAPGKPAPAFTGEAGQKRKGAQVPPPPPRKKAGKPPGGSPPPPDMPHVYHNARVPTGFPWWNNSCCADSWMTLLWRIFLQYLDVAGKDVFMREYPVLGELFVQLGTSTLSFRYNVVSAHLTLLSCNANDSPSFLYCYPPETRRWRGKRTLIFLT